MQATIRRAVPADATGLVVLRAAMFAAMGQDAGDDAAAWRQDARAWFEVFLRSDEGLVVVADLPGSGLVSSALGQLEQRAPSPSNRAGLVGHLSQVVTLPEHRRNGYARACLVSLLGWFDRTGIERVDLFATDDGAAVYRDLGFVMAPYPALRRRRYP